VTVLDDVQLTLIRTPDDVAAFRRWIGERRPVHALGFDTETTGLDIRNDDVRLIQFGDGRHGWAMDREDWLGLARWVFDTWDGRYVTHNGALFDIPIMKNSCGIDIPRERVDDTLVACRINEPHYSAALKNQAVRHVDPAAAGLATVLHDTTWGWDDVPVIYGPYWQYGALDPVLAYCLWEHHGPIVQSTAPDSYDLELSVLWVLERMMRNGVHVDRSLAQRKFDEFTLYAAEVEQWCQTHFKVRPGSNDAVVRVLRDAGVEFTKLTAKGKDALDKDVLEGIDHPLARAVLSRRQLQKIASTYLRAFIELADENDVVHPGINPQGALTSRMSMEGPNFQNLPVRGSNPGGEVVRRCVDSRYGADGRLVLCDFDQIEMRLLAHLSQDAGLIAAFHSTQDFFVNLARQIFGDDTIQKSDPRRQITKNASYANAYGAGAAKFALTAGIPEAQAVEFMRRYRGMYPGVPQLQQSVHATASRRLREEGVAYVRSPLTGRRWVADQKKIYALVNYLIQGVAAETFKMKLLALDALGLAEFMCIPVHDEVILDVPLDRVAEVAETLRTGMTDLTTFAVPITAGVSTGKNWRDKEEWVLAA